MSEDIYKVFNGDGERDAQTRESVPEGGPARPHEEVFDPVRLRWRLNREMRSEC